MRALLTIIATVFALCGYAQDAKTIESRPDSYNYLRGVEAVQNGNNEEALEYLNKEISENPKNGYAYSWIAMIREQQDEYGRALSAANLSIKHLPKKDVEYLYFVYEVRARVHAELEDTVSALSDYTAAIKLMPEKDGAYENRAQIYYEQGKYDLGDNDYRKLISLDQGGVMGYMGLGRNRNAQKLWDEAIEQFDYVAKLHSDYSSVYAFRAESYIGKRNWDKATDDIVTALKIDSNDMAFYLMQDLEDAPFTMLKVKFQIQAAKETNEGKWPYYLGIIHERKEQYKQAVKYYEAANKRDASAYNLERIAVCYERDGQYENCLFTLDQALNMEPQRMSLQTLKANILYEAGRTKDAIEQWDSILVTHPDYAWGYYRRGWFKENIDEEGAIEDFSLAITLDPADTYSYISRANLYDKQGKNELAKADYEKIIEIEKDPKDYENAHYAFQALGNYEKAIEVMDSIIARDSTEAGTFYDAACLYARMKKPQDAMRYLEKSLQMGYKRFAHMENDHDMDSLRELQEYKDLIKKYKDSAKDELLRTRSNASTSQEKIVEVPFTKDNGSSLCNVKCTINELPLYFIFDTGASDVSLSQVEATFMMKNGYLNKSDVVGNAYFTDAVGNVNVGTIINLRKVDFGGVELTNVKASVVRNQKAPLLLGQSIRGRLGKIEIDNSQKILRITQQ